MIVRAIALLGHKDHGKSTLIGSMLMQTGSATQVRINEAAAYSKKLHKSFEPAFILDSFSEEREQEMTYDTTRAQIKYKDLAFSLIDVPGHEELIKNMISGASYGELAILLVSAKKDEGIMNQTKRHLFVARMLGIDKLVVAVNKMDSVGYDENRFESIKSELSEFIDRIGFEGKNVIFVPISAYNGENLVNRSTRMGWYRGDTLADSVYNTFRTPTSNIGSGALRIIVQGIIDQNNNIIAGKVISGILKKGEAILLLPNRETATVKEIIVKGKKVNSAGVGENAAMIIDSDTKGELRGAVISGLKDSPEITDSVTARIFVTNTISNNSYIKFNGVDVKCLEIKVLDGIDTTTGKKTGRKTAEPLNAIDARVTFGKKLPVENYNVTKELGRFVLYSNNVFAGIGMITKIRQCI
jgi:translation elongation factor EF-1alpha